MKRIALAIAIAVMATTGTAYANHGTEPHGPWDCIRARESGGTTDPHGNYDDSNGGSYQFQDATFQSVTGLPGSAQDYPPEVQDQAAIALQERSGWGQWSVAAGCDASGDGAVYASESPGEQAATATPIAGTPKTAG